MKKVLVTIAALMVVSVSAFAENNKNAAPSQDEGQQQIQMLNKELVKTDLLASNPMKSRHGNDSVAATEVIRSSPPQGMTDRNDYNLLTLLTAADQ